MSASTTTRQPSPERAVRLPYRPRGFNKRSRQRFERDRRGELVRRLGHEPSYPEWLIIGRIIAIEFELQKFDAKMLAGEELSGHLLRGRLAAEIGYALICASRVTSWQRGQGGAAGGRA